QLFVTVTRWCKPWSFLQTQLVETASLPGISLRHSFASAGLRREKVEYQYGCSEPQKT
ncbi:hypothetical protein CHARACLAT_016055, partial [Characodon lateralis]|nr:hypothetical protein [Characodon lateralis]